MCFSLQRPQLKASQAASWRKDTVRTSSDGPGCGSSQHCSPSGESRAWIVRHIAVEGLWPQNTVKNV